LGHEGAVWCLEVKGELFVTGSADRSVSVNALSSWIGF